MHAVIFVRNTYLEEFFDHVASQNMFIWGFHHILLVSFPQKNILQGACSNCAKLLSNVLLILDSHWTSYLLKS